MDEASTAARRRMAWSASFSGKPVAALWPYALAVLSVSFGLGIALLFQRLGFRAGQVPLLLFAVATSSWYGGTGAAALAFLLSCLAFDYFFTEPLYSLYIVPADIPYFIVFALFAALITWFSAVRRRVERDLRQAREHLEIEVVQRTRQASLLNLTHDTIFVRDMDDVITYWNRGAEELYGWTQEQATGKDAHELLHSVFSTPIEQIRQELLRTGRWEGALHNARADGTTVMVASRWSLQRDERGRPTAILETNNDITERERRAEEIRSLNVELGKRTAQLEASNKELEAFAYSVSHDLRAPLRHMAGFSELLQKNIASQLDEKSRRYISTILEASRRMGALIDDLLSFSRIGRAEARKSMVSLGQLVEEALAEVRRDAADREIIWKIGELPSAYGDRSMLRLALVNLISNAVKFTRTRSPATIEIGPIDHDPDQLGLFIRDNGVGFDMKYRNKLFGVFQRLHAAEAFEGTGIGLATVLRIAHRHGGRAWAEGALGEGATFYFSVSKTSEYKI
ncbi:MAG: PAS domain S-box protein [Verrucomicrobia bacterium]|nr:PAS domain S-box protein [Verrucomicrobiota bacterium]